MYYLFLTKGGIIMPVEFGETLTITKNYMEYASSMGINMMWYHRVLPIRHVLFTDPKKQGKEVMLGSALLFLSTTHNNQL